MKSPLSPSMCSVSQEPPQIVPRSLILAWPELPRVRRNTNCHNAQAMARHEKIKTGLASAFLLKFFLVNVPHRRDAIRKTAVGLLCAITRTLGFTR
jgi:hypothetical protein